MPRVLLTRPLDRSEQLAAELARDGWEAILWPLLTIRSLQTEPINPWPDNLIFTSVRGVEALIAPLPTTARVWCVGPATAAAAAGRGFVDVIDADGDADKLIDLLLANAQGDMLHVRGEDARGNIAARLRNGGARARDVIAYKAVATTDTPEQIDTAIKGGNIDVIALFSPRTASILVQLSKEDWAAPLKRMTLVAISESAAKPALALGFERVVIADAPNGAAMRAAICGAAI